jgi:hypothetical protein
LRDLGVGRKSVWERFLDFVSLCKGLTLTERQKCQLAIVAGPLGVYLGLGAFRCVAVLLFNQAAIPYPFVDWWWIFLNR